MAKMQSQYQFLGMQNINKPQNALLRAAIAAAGGFLPINQ